MKKKFFMLILVISFFYCPTANALERYQVSLKKCVDGDTAWFNLNKESIKARFLAIDTPESTNKIEPFGKEASNFTCNLLSNASKIEIEYDAKSEKLDKYDRHLVWVYIDNILIQEELLKNGLAEVKYLYADYAYTENLKNVEKIAKQNKIGMWKSNDNQIFTKENLILTIGVIGLIIGYIFNSKIRKKTNKILKKEMNKKIDDLF